MERTTAEVSNIFSWSFKNYTSRHEYVSRNKTNDFSTRGRVALDIIKFTKRLLYSLTNVSNSVQDDIHFFSVEIGHVILLDC